MKRQNNFDLICITNCSCLLTNVIGFVLALLFVPETKALSLEELDSVFSVPTNVHARYQMRKLGWFFRKYVMCGRKRVPDMEPLYHHEGPKTAAPMGAAAA